MALAEVRRATDGMIRPHATDGVFKVKAQNPRLLAGLDTAQTRMTFAFGD